MDDAIEAANNEVTTRIPELTALLFTGPDAGTFLQGYFTRDTTKLTDGTWLPNALCSLKGRVVANGWAQQAEDTIFWIVHRSVAETTAKLLEPYLRFSKTSAVLSSEPVCANSAATRFEVGGATSTTDDGQWWETRTRCGDLIVTDLTADRYLPQMVGLASTAVDFDKGCYLGQEVVARAQHRGQVKRALGLIEAAGSVGDELMDDAGKQVGEVVQSGTTSALVVVRSGVGQVQHDGNSVSVAVFED